MFQASASLCGLGLLGGSLGGDGEGWGEWRGVPAQSSLLFPHAGST